MSKLAPSGYPSYQSTEPTDFGQSTCPHPPSYHESFPNAGPTDDPERQVVEKYVVSDLSVEIRNAFIRKVYSILTAMLLVTVATSSFLIYSKSAQVWVQNSPGFVIASSILSLVVYLILFWKRKSYPTNYILLSIFTLLQSFAIGAIVTFYDSSVVLQAFLITSGVFIGLTLFTFQTKYDFSGLAPVLFVGLLVLVLAGIVNIFIPFSHGFNLFIAILGVLVFSGLVLWDTQMICQQLSPEEYILGVVGLYIDFINLFLYFLRLFQECKTN